MDAFTTVTGVAVPLRRSNVDTDQIIPAQFLKRITKTGYDDALFYAWRQDSDFVLNQQPYRAGRVLVAGPDFGTGSSREHAVWALRDYGFDAVLSPRFADIFRSNAAKQGLLAGQISEEDCERLWNAIEHDPGIAATVDLLDRSVSLGDLVISFRIDDDTRRRLLEGLDDIALTLRSEKLIRDFESRREGWRPTTMVR